LIAEVHIKLSFMYSNFYGFSINIFFGGKTSSTELSADNLYQISSDL